MNRYRQTGFVLINRQGRWWTGQAWSDDPAKAKTWYRGDDPWQKASEMAARLTAGGEPCIVLHSESGASASHGVPPLDWFPAITQETNDDTERKAPGHRNETVAEDPAQRG